MNNIQKSFKAKSKLRGMADGGQIDPNILGSGMAQRAATSLQDRRSRIDAAVDDAVIGTPPPPSPAPAPAPAPAPTTPAKKKKPEEKSALRSFFGLADGGQVFKDTVGGIPTYTDARAASATATAHTPGSGGGTFSVVGMEPAQKQQMAEAIARRQAPTTLGGRLDAALSKLNSPLTTTGAPSSTPTFSPEPDAAAPDNVGRIMNSRDMSIFTPQETKTFNSMSQAAVADAARMQDIGVQAGQAAMATARPASPFQPSGFDTPSDELEFADGGDVKGKGGPTDDKVGPVMLSDGEYVLPADTVDIVGRENLDALRLATHDFVDERNKPKISGLRKMADGGVVLADDRPLRLTQGAAPPMQPPGGGGIVTYQPPPPPPPSGGGLPAIQPAGGGRGVVPHQPPLATRVGTPSEAPPAGAGGARGPLRTVGRVLGPAFAAYQAYTDSPEDRARAAAGETGAAGVAAQVGSYLTSGLTFNAASPQDVGGYIAAAQGKGSEPYHSVPADKRGWARSLGERYFPTESQRIMDSTAKLSGGAQREVSALRSAGIDVASINTEEDYARAREALASISRPSQDTSMEGSMGNLRRGQAPGNGFVDSNYPGIYMRPNPNAGNPGESANQYIGVGTPAPRTEDPIMGEIRSALRSLTDGASNRGGGGGAVFIGGGNARDINARYDKLAEQLRGMYGPKGQGNLARRLLELEQARWSALDADARNQSTLRGQDVQASTAANSADMQARMQALQTLNAMASQRSQQSAQAQAAQLKALQDAQKESDDREQEGVADLATFSRDMFGEDDPRAAEFQRYIVQTNPNILGMGSKERNFAMTEAYAQFLGEGPIRERAKRLGAPISQGRNVLSPDVVDVTLVDVWNDRAELGDWRPWSTDNYQMVDSEGNPVLKVPVNEYIRNQDGSRNADLINDLARRSALRSKNGE